MSKTRKSDERRGLPRELARHDGEHQQEGDDLVPHHRAVVGDAEAAAGELARPDADERKPRPARRASSARRHQRRRGPSRRPGERACRPCPARAARGPRRSRKRPHARDARTAKRRGRAARRSWRSRKWSKPPRCAIGAAAASRTTRRAAPASMAPMRVSGRPSSRGERLERGAALARRGEHQLVVVAAREHAVALELGVVSRANARARGMRA